ncbi:MAG: exo-alpha-sialidase, partial [Phaeodactylibacter sp.]|nr:exo-alpha-sialidase [Phaeodactylibacter sp.]
MNQLKWTTLAGALLIATFGNLAAQQIFSKQWIYEQGRSALARKVKASPEELQALQQQLTAQEEGPAAVSFRNQETNISDSEKPESEVHAAINPRDTNNIIIAGMVLDAESLLGTLSFPIYYTKDFGQSWGLSEFDGVSDLGPFSLILGGGDPVLAFDTDGTAYLSWLTFTINANFTIGIQLHWAISTDGGESWQRQESYIDAGDVASLDSPNSRFVDKEWLATDLSSSLHRNNLYAAYVEINLSDTTYNILVKTKPADSNEFGEAVDVTPEEIAFSQFSSIDVDRQGNVHVLFAGATAQDVALGIYHCVSEDGGASFSDPVRISSLHLPCFPPGAGGDCDLVGIDSARVYPCPHLRVDKSGGEFDGNLYAVWTSDGFETELTSGVDIYYSYSKDGG